MNTKRYTLSVFVGFVFVFLFEFMFHGNILKSTYESTAELWRPEEEMEHFLHWMTLCQLGFVAALAFIFTRHYEGKGIPEGVRFGLMLGVLIGIGQFAVYSYMPISMGLALAWFGGAVVEMVGLGIIFSLLYKH